MPQLSNSVFQSTTMLFLSIRSLHTDRGLNRDIQIILARKVSYVKLFAASVAIPEINAECLRRGHVPVMVDRMNRMTWLVSLSGGLVAERGPNVSWRRERGHCSRSKPANMHVAWVTGHQPVRCVHCIGVLRTGKVSQPHAMRDCLGLR